LAANGIFVYTFANMSVRKKPLRSYSLALADGQRWSFVALADAGPWVERLATIMGLQESSRGPVSERLIVVTRNAHEGAITVWEDGLTQGSTWASLGHWHPVNPSPYQHLLLYSSDNGRAFMFDVGREKDPEEECVKMQQALSLIFRETIKGGGFPFHCALFDCEGKAVLLAGSGGAGKSTCYRLAEAPFEPLCDDLCIVVREHSRAFAVHPLPTWSDYLWRKSKGAWQTSRSLPLKAIFFLKHGRANEIVPVGQGEASMLINALARQMFEPSWIYGSVHEKRVLRRRLFQSASDVARAVPSFVLRFKESGGFWKSIERVLGS
jgi:SynChlorMet cassette protein ScmC